MYAYGDQVRFTLHDGRVVQGFVMNVEYTKEYVVVWITDAGGMLHKCIAPRQPELRHGN